jgi:hypothetical protein
LLALVELEPAGELVAPRGLGKEVGIVTTVIFRLDLVDDDAMRTVQSVD